MDDLINFANTHVDLIDFISTLRHLNSFDTMNKKLKAFDILEGVITSEILNSEEKIIHLQEFLKKFNEGVD